MASISKHPADINRWITKVIISCNTSEQLEGAEKMAQKYYDKGRDLKKCDWSDNYEHRMAIGAKKQELH